MFQFEYRLTCAEPDHRWSASAVAFLAARGEAVDSATRPGAVSARATGAFTAGIQQWPGHSRGATPTCIGGAAFFRGTDGTVVTQEGITIAAGNTTLASGARRVAGPGAGGCEYQQQRRGDQTNRELRHKKTALREVAGCYQPFTDRGSGLQGGLMNIAWQLRGIVRESSRSSGHGVKPCPLRSVLRGVLLSACCCGCPDRRSCWSG